MDVLRIEGLRKSFGPHAVLDDLTLAVPEHSVFGFVGQNGAGKTTTMKIILGLVKPDAGEVTVCGERVRFGQTKTNRLIGYLPDVPEFYGYMRPREYMTLCGRIAGLDARRIAERSEALLALVGLGGVRQRIVGFSRGMKQRLGIAQALLGNPKLLVCDEPTSALDPLGRKEILDILMSVREETTVLFSTHILSDVERICDHVAVLHGGQVTLGGTLEEVRAQRRHNRLLIAFDQPSDLSRLKALPDVTAYFAGAEQTADTATLRVRSVPEAEAALLAACVREALLPARLERLEPTLESLFLEAVQ